MHIRIEGGSLTDVLYTHETEGSFNVTRLLANLHLAQKASFPFNETIIRGNRLADVCEDVQRAMTLERALLPVIALQCRNGTVIFADGNNRLRWLIDHGVTEARCYFFTYAQREQFRMRVMICENGIWREENHKDAVESMRGKHHPMGATP